MQCRCKPIVHISQNVKLTSHFLKSLKQRALIRKFRSTAHNVLVPVWGLAVTSHLFILSLQLRHTIPFGLYFSVGAAVRHHGFYKLQQSMPSLIDLSHIVKIRRFLDRLTTLVVRMVNDSSLKKKPPFIPQLNFARIKFRMDKDLKGSYKCR